MTNDQLVTSKRRSRNFVIAAVIALALLFVIPFAAAAVQNGNNTRASLNASKTDSSSTASPSPSASPEADSCEAAYTQVASNNDGNRVIGDFEVRYAAASADANNISDAQRTLLLEESGKNASVLAAWSHALGLYENTSEWQELVDGNCLSSKGMKLHNQLEGALSAKGTTFEEAQAPANSFNSGVNNGVYGVSDVSGVYGDLKSIKVTLKDGTVAYILVRCGNPVYPGKPNLPTVPTDNPPPPPPPPVEPPVEPKNINEAPQRQGNVPEQQKPNPLPTRPDHAQPAQPADPPAVNVPPAAPPAQPAPVGPVPPPKVDPKPPVITPPVAPAPAPSDPGTSTPCAPGQTTC